MVKEKENMFVQPHSNFCGRKRSVYVMSKCSIRNQNACMMNRYPKTQ
jgi:hypothetical protein